MKKTLYLMRHGQTLFNKLGKIQGACDSPLTPEGIQQAKEAAVFFDDKPIDHAYSSTSERSSDTLELITDLPYQRLKGLKEMNFGVFEGESERLNPKHPNMYLDYFVQYGGESADQVTKRMRTALFGIMNSADHQNVLAVSHAGASMHFLSEWADPELLFSNGGFPNCTICQYDFDTEAQLFELMDIIRPFDQ